MEWDSIDSIGDAITKLFNEKYKHKHKYKWLENAEIYRNDDDTDIKFFNIANSKEYLEVRLRENKTVGYLIDGSKKIKKKHQPTIPNIKNFLWEYSFSNEEGIGRAFSSIYRSRSFEFICSILPAFNIFNYDATKILLNDKNFIKSFDKAKEEIDKIYNSIKKSYE